LLLRENPMPATTGRVCYHPCEGACNRRQFDEAVSIHAVERMLGDAALDFRPAPPAPAARRPESAAIVGSGPAGLSCAWHLARLGYRVTIFEAAAEPGGMLRLGIPSYRLPRAILDAEIDRIRAAGVEILCNRTAGLDPSVDDLNRFDAVFAGPGLHRSRTLGLRGERLRGVMPGIAFLREVNSGRRASIGRRVVIVGGGNTAVDCARSALRLGAEPVVVYRRGRDEMPAFDEEVRDAEREGASFIFLAAPVRLRSRAGRVYGADFARMKLGLPDASGRRAPIAIPGDRFFLQSDLVLTAIGEELDAQGLPPGIDHGGIVRFGDLGETVRPGLFAGGDVLAGPRTVAEALGSGKRAAIGIDRHLRRLAGQPPDLPEVPEIRFGPMGNVSITRWRRDDPIRRQEPLNQVIGFDRLNTAHFEHALRHEDRHAPASARRLSFMEVNAGLAKDAALAEAARCFNCGVCNQCELCQVFCPDVAIARRPDGAGMMTDYDYCKGCGLCSCECPRGAVTMTREDS
ncbi:MAG TPA: FAD-dependent oxidoreductase, partial [Candidatus Polarisedimenticolia bacterium]|nr:FAD-dependent oxidoreductase [Candidatus Polarisedimenticolia bacterium]